MFLFDLHYIDINTEEKRITTLKVDSSLFDSDKEVFLYVINIAYDSMEAFELFYRLDYKGFYETEWI